MKKGYILETQLLGQQVLRAGITDVSGIANIADIADIADIGTDIADIATGITDVVNSAVTGLAQLQQECLGETLDRRVLPSSANSIEFCRILLT